MSRMTLDSTLKKTLVVCAMVWPCLSRLRLAPVGDGAEHLNRRCNGRWRRLHIPLADCRLMLVLQALPGAS